MNDSPSGVVTPLTERLDRFLRTASAGETFTYCVATNLGDKSVTDEERATAEQARIAYAQGRVELCQRKCGKEYQYQAIKRKDVSLRLVNGLPWLPKIPKTYQGV